ncbi:hypothetical protein TKK_0009874 [Trichogramma kaykai]|uniref:Receptor L-domain domain-containing protein n=1 Tax=Trichogramma kaykai TaxID=54128 RepID=A0ABD2X1H3_9HYME
MVNNNITSLHGTATFKGTDIQIQGHSIQHVIGDVKPLETQPIVIDNHRLRFEPLKTLTIPTLKTISKFEQPQNETSHIFISNLTLMAGLVILICGYIGYIYIKRRQPRKQAKPKKLTNVTNAEDVLELRRGRVI